MKGCRRALAAIALAIFLIGCGGSVGVHYDGGQCLKDGRPLTAAEVEAEQATVASRIASRQPWFTVITIGVVVLAALGNVEKALLFVRARRGEGHGPLAERLREVLARQREKPAVMGTVVGGSLVLIVVAGAAYGYLDIEKRTSERALGMLQFCHLALRTKEEQGALDEQRRNLQAIQSTAGDIRTLVGKLPPEQQRKAQLIVDQLNGALDRQGKAVKESVARADEAQRDLSTHTAAMEKGLASMEGDLAALRALPDNLKDLEGAAQHIDATTSSFELRLAEVKARVDAVDAKLDGLIARPVCAPPAPVVTAAKAERGDGGAAAPPPPAHAAPATPPSAAAAADGGAKGS